MSIWLCGDCGKINKGHGSCECQKEKEDRINLFSFLFIMFFLGILLGRLLYLRHFN